VFACRRRGEYAPRFGVESKSPEARKVTKVKMQGIGGYEMSQERIGQNKNYEKEYKKRRAVL